MEYPIAQKFKNGEYKKPVLSKDVFYKGGITAMVKKFKSAVIPFDGTYSEFVKRTEDCATADVVYTMWDYIRVE